MTGFSSKKGLNLIKEVSQELEDAIEEEE